MRVRGSIVEPALIGEKDRRAEFATVVDRVASKPRTLACGERRHPQKLSVHLIGVDECATRQ